MKKSNLVRNLIIGAVLLIVLLLIAKKAGWLGDDETLKVSTDQVSRHTITETVSASGKVQPEVEVKMSADVSGEVVDLYVKEGDVVKKGTLLAKINPEIYVSMRERMVAGVNTSKAALEGSRSRLIQAESQLERANLTYQRNKKLFDEGAISMADFEAIKSAYEVAKAEVDAARQAVMGSDYGVKSSEAGLKEANENLNKTSIFAPVDGTISKLSVEKGERVVGTSQFTGTEIMRIANLNEMEVSVDVSENDIVRVHLNDTAIIDIDAYLDRKFKGIITEIANSANVTGLTTDQVTNFTVKIRILRDSYLDLIPASDPSYSPFRPGMSATVEIQTKKMSNVLAVPIQAVTTRDTTLKESSKRKLRPGETKKAETAETTEDKTTECVFIVQDGKAKMVVVKTGIQDNNFIQVTEGLKENQEVITAPYNAISRTLKDGAIIKIVKKEELFDKEKSK
jgi:HlyD family secretion protein